MKSIYGMLFIGLLSFNVASQSVNDYKYVFVPNHYEWAKEVDKYQINSLTTFLFKKYGFEAFQGLGNLPKNIDINSCDLLTADVEEKASLFRTELKVVLKDCNDKIVFTSQKGSSKLKEFKPAYHEALRRAFKSVKELQYTYTGNNTVDSMQATKQPSGNTSAPLQEEESLAKIPDEVVAVPEKTETAVADRKPTTVVATNSDQEVLEVDHYRSTDSVYRLDISVGSMIFYEGSKVIGKITSRAAASYQIVTSEFSGKGYFQNEQFVIERKIKGVPGIVQMIFEKQ
jgi:hypothetical protein